MPMPQYFGLASMKGSGGEEEEDVRFRGIAALVIAAPEVGFVSCEAAVQGPLRGINSVLSEPLSKSIAQYISYITKRLEKNPQNSCRCCRGDLRERKLPLVYNVNSELFLAPLAREAR